MNATHKGIVTLLKSAITGQPLSLPQGFSLEAAADTVLAQGLAPLVWQGAYNCGISPQGEPMQRFRRKYLRGLMRSECQMRAVEVLCKAFDDNGIDYMPLKGCVLKSYYPHPEMRPMGDADILIRMEQYDKIRPIMQRLGYTDKDETHHELIWQGRELLVELHKCLFAPTQKDLYGYFGSGWDMAMKQQGCRYGLRSEDEFSFIFAHMAKHYRGSGVSCRHILDIYIYRRAYPQMDEGYIEQTMDKLRLLEFYRNICRLLAVWFADGEPDDKTEMISEYVLGGCISEETRLYTEAIRRTGGKGDLRHTKARAVVAAIFPPLEKLQYEFRVLFRYPFLFPVFWVVRWWRLVFRRPDRSLRKLAALRGMTDEKVSARQQMLRQVGLDYHT